MAKTSSVKDVLATMVAKTNAKGNKVLKFPSPYRG